MKSFSQFKRTSVVTAIFLSIGTFVSAQSMIGLTAATSKSDNHMETFWYQQQIFNRFSLGLQIRNSDVKYRFIDAKAIKNGNAFFAGLTLGFKIKEQEDYRLDFNLTTSYRRLKNKGNEQLPQFTDGIEIDPNLLFSLKTGRRIVFHTGIMLRTAVQLNPEAIPDEQLPSAILLNGLSYQLNQSALTLRTYAGPMNGAGGDTEKFFWQVSLGYQYTFPGKFSSSIPFINF